MIVSFPPKEYMGEEAKIHQSVQKIIIGDEE